LVLAEAANEWKNDPVRLRRASTERLRGSEMSDRELAKRQADERYHLRANYAEPDPIMDKKVSSLLNAIVDAPASRDTLFRGVRWSDSDLDTTDFYRVLADTPVMAGNEQVGDIVDWGPSGFSYDPKVARGFSTNGYAGGSSHIVIYELEKGAKAFDVDAVAKGYSGEGERVVAGTFEVTEVVDMGTHTLVSIRQTEPLGSPPGGGRW
jgi:hypothetical protein